MCDSVGAAVKQRDILVGEIMNLCEKFRIRIFYTVSHLAYGITKKISISWVSMCERYT